MSTAVEARNANWLPLPPEIKGKSKPKQVVDEDDLFSKGEVVSYYPKQGFGFLRSASGAEILFRVGELEVIGTKKEEDLAVGLRVGYDVSHASKGLHVCRLKIY